MPATAHCEAAADWDPLWKQYEDEVLHWTNQYRTGGTNCGADYYGPAPVVSMSPALRCAARLHSKDMSDNDYFDHTTPDGVRFSERITNAGYSWRTAGENIAYGYRSPEAVVNAWVASTGHCRNLMNPVFSEIGIGFYEGWYWTQDFAAPR